MMERSKQSGFSLLEVIVSLTLFVFAILLVNSLFSLSQRAYRAGSNQGELTQNVRISLDRISREVRQSEEIVSIMPIADTDPLDPPISEIFFQDGHNIEIITYVRYYLSSNNLMRSHIAYYFSADPTTYVRWDSVDGFSNPPDTLILENRIVGEYFNKLEFWGDNGLVHISLGVNKKSSDLDIETSVFSRNW